MKIWICRHGQTNLNKKELMQGRVDEPLNETGINQAKKARKLIGDIKFDAVYASPLKRALLTASIIGNVDIKDIIVDDRIIETDFGKYDLKNYHKMGVAMTLYWALPEIFPAPDTVETVSSMVKRSHSFLKELEKKEYDNVLVVCHGGIIRALCGYLEDKKNKIKWRPKPKNCEIRVYSSKKGKHDFLKSYKEK
ncbi:alpha-ribazole phosphatase/probable phosphoglycerate mutase [Acetitomaculum ruminis DSM 5522]|uniref:Alpha-ribazole phosphatase/probable phosphoglycerate mutase n=1 Tax=Acetitomaculum ruminis DSM 5522 TaxID=1120918 RepID=A0A1I0YHV6_9FIRM|nr:histidine phosphatase family protein [Acetitomaculum ruminis]SFB12914.1 alpha-ribazole phosphatase/probable phosphoglycerate mutase [Acetitomaculum ruminis DSM 5522]